MQVFPRSRQGFEVASVVSRVEHADSPSGGCGILNATFVVRGEFQLRHGGVAEPIADRPVVCSGDLFHAEPQQGVAYPGDFVPFKPAGEWMAVGTAYNAGYGEAGRFGVRVRIGQQSKLIDVLGDRTWVPTLLRWRPGPAEATGPIPLTYDRAWGGPSYAMNPLGRGRVGEAMPNLETPGAWVDSRSSRVAPAGFGPLPSHWPQRQKWMGKYNARWVREHWPWLPPDFDYRFFMAAPEDQWALGYFRGDEPLVFEQMHPDHAVYQSQLPGVRARCFVTQRSESVAAETPGDSGGESVFREVPLNLDTVWVDLDQEKLVLVWRGRLPVASIKLLDIQNVLALVEPLDQPDPGLQFYKQSLAEQCVPRKQQGPPRVDAAAVRAQIDAAFAQAAKERAEIEAMIAKETAKAEAMLAESRQKAAAAGQTAGIDWQTPELGTAVKVPESPQEAIASLRKELAGLEAFTGFDVSKQIASVKEAIAGLEEADALVASLPDQIRAREQAILAKIPPELLVVRKLPTGAPIDLEAARNHGFAKFDLAGVDFSGLDLSGVNFRGARLRGAKLTGTTLRGADFTNANLSGADLTGADLRDATLDDVDLTSAVVSAVRWTGASLSRTRLSGLQLAGADFTGARGKYANFWRATLVDACFANAELESANFREAVVQRTDFSGAKLCRADFGSVQAAGIVLRGATLTNFRAREQADFSNAVVAGAVADDSTWVTSTLDGIDFRQATMRRAQFSEASLRGAIFDRCNLADAVFDDANVENGVLTHANLLRATFDRTNLTNARLDGSNLYEAGFWEATLDGATHAGANIKRTRLAQ